MEDLLRNNTFRRKEVNEIIDNILSIVKNDSCIQDYELKIFKDCIRSVIEKDELIEHHFEIIGRGCFKICVDLFENWVLKFIVESNETEDGEQQLYLAAQEEGLGFLFPETHYWGIPSVVRKDYLLSDDGEDIYCEFDEERYSSSDVDPDFIFSHICLQRKVDFVWADSYEHIQENNTFMVEEKAELKGNCIDSVAEGWLKMVYDRYGKDSFNHFSTFYSKSGISDLHDENIGVFYDANGVTRPVIIDCLSSQL